MKTMMYRVSEKEAYQVTVIKETATMAIVRSQGMTPILKRVKKSSLYNIITESF